MARIARYQIINEKAPGTYHVISRMVRSCFFMGNDQITGKNYDHRRMQVWTLIQTLSRIFMIDVLSVGIMQNYFHEVLRNRPDLVAQMSDFEVALRTCLLHELGHRLELPSAPATAEKRAKFAAKIQDLLSDQDRLQKARADLSNISVYQQRLKSTIARIANKEDGVSGPVFAGRFRSFRILDSVALLTTMVYIDLDPVRVGLTDRIEGSLFTSACERVQKLISRMELSRPHMEWTQERKVVDFFTEEQLEAIHSLANDREVNELMNGWLCPIDDRSGESIGLYADWLEAVGEEVPPGLEDSQSRQVVRSIEASRSQLVSSFGGLTAPRVAEESTVELAQKLDVCSNPTPVGPEIDAREVPEIHRLPARASSQGCLPMSLCEYSKVINWVAERMWNDEPLPVPQFLGSVLGRLGIEDPATWYAQFQEFCEAIRLRFSAPVNQLADASRCLVGTVWGVRALPNALL